MTEETPATARTSAWHAVPDAVGVARQLRPTDLRGLPATLQYGATLSGVALAAARSRPRTVVLVDDEGGITGSELESAIDAVAGGLAALLRSRAAREIVVCCGGHRGLVAAVAAAGALGVDATLVAPSAGAETIRDLVRTADVVVVDASTSSLVADLAPHADLLDARLVASRLPGRSLRSVPRPRRPGTLALLTSGTTGRPRLTPRAHAGLGQLATVLSLMHALDLHRDEPVVVAPPLPHGHGLSLLTAAMVVGARAVLAHGHDGGGLVQLLRVHAAGVLAVVPAQLVEVLDAVEMADDRPRTLRRVATGSAPLPAELVHRTRDLLGDVLVDFYGSSEVGTATVATAADLRDAPGTVGRPVAGVTVDVVDTTGRPVAAGVTGQVRVSSPWRALSTASGTVAVGDLGHLDERGRLFLDGRVDDDVVVVGGHNVSVARVRSWFEQQPGVTQAEVAVTPHDELGHELVVTVTGEAEPADLSIRALAQLGSAQAPRRVRRAVDDDRV